MNPAYHRNGNCLFEMEILNRDCRAGCFKQRSPEHLSFKHFFFASIHWLAQLDLHLPNAYFVP